MRSLFFFFNIFKLLLLAPTTEFEGHNLAPCFLVYILSIIYNVSDLIISSLLFLFHDIEKRCINFGVYSHYFLKFTEILNHT